MGSAELADIEALAAAESERDTALDALDAAWDATGLPQVARDTLPLYDVVRDYVEALREAHDTIARLEAGAEATARETALAMARQLERGVRLGLEAATTQLMRDGLLYAAHALGSVDSASVARAAEAAPAAEVEAPLTFDVWEGGYVHYTRPSGDPLLDEAQARRGYTVRPTSERAAIEAAARATGEGAANDGTGGTAEGEGAS